MEKMAPEGSQIDAKEYDSKMQQLLQDDDEFFTSYDEVFEGFDHIISLQENVLRGIDAFGNNTNTGADVLINAPAELGRRKKKGKRKGKARKTRSTPDDGAAQPQDRQQPNQANRLFLWFNLCGRV